MDQRLRSPIATVLSRPNLVEPFSQFQGFSSQPNHHEQEHPRFGIYEYPISDGDISPRMPIPNPVIWGPSQPRVQTLLDDHDEDLAQFPIYQSCCSLDSDTTVDVIAEQYQTPMRQQWFSSQHCNTIYPPAVPYTCMSGLVETSHYVQEDHDGGSCSPMSFIITRPPNTFRVPSDSESGQLSGSLDSPPFEALSDISEAEEDGASIPSSTLGEGASTIYPEDSVSTASRAGALPNTQARRTLVDDVVEVHDICLVATQRYLEGLRVNWDLRNTHPVNGGDAHSLGDGPSRSRDRERRDQWSPYAGAELRERTRSESHLEHIAVEGPGQRHGDHDHHHTALTQKNPIPSFTNSLLQNISQICGLIWRRAQRDREDVLGAEARGCRDMSLLHECGETIVLYSARDAERDPEECLHRVVVAGTALCQELKDWEGLRLMGRWEGGGQVEVVQEDIQWRDRRG